MAAKTEVDAELQALVGQTIDERYRIDEVLGSGGMGAVFKGYHLGLEHEVAIKVLHPDLMGRTSAKRFQREAQSASKLDHPNIVRVTDFGSLPNGGNYLVMQLLEGQELTDMLGGPWVPERAVNLIMQVCSALEHAHYHGIVHRDLKPANIFITSDHRGKPVAKLLDFGIAKVMQGDKAGQGLTQTGMVFGTPRYMSPEQATGDVVDQRTDIYAVGVMLFELLAGHPPFQGPNSSQVMRLQLTAPPPMLPETVPPALSALVREMLEKSPGDRPPSVAEVLERLEDIKPRLKGIPAAPITRAEATAATSSPALDITAPPTAAGGSGMGMNTAAITAGGPMTAMEPASQATPPPAPAGAPPAGAPTAALTAAATAMEPALSSPGMAVGPAPFVPVGPPSASMSAPAREPTLSPQDSGSAPSHRPSSPLSSEASMRRVGLIAAIAVVLLGGVVFALGATGIVPGLGGGKADDADADDLPPPSEEEGDETGAGAEVEPALPGVGDPEEAAVPAPAAATTDGAGADVPPPTEATAHGEGEATADGQGEGEGTAPAKKTPRKKAKKKSAPPPDAAAGGGATEDKGPMKIKPSKPSLPAVNTDG